MCRFLLTNPVCTEYGPISRSALIYNYDFTFLSSSSSDSFCIFSYFLCSVLHLRKKLTSFSFNQSSLTIASSTKLAGVIQKSESPILFLVTQLMAPMMHLMATNCKLFSLKIIYAFKSAHENSSVVPLSVKFTSRPYYLVFASICKLGLDSPYIHGHFKAHNIY